MSLAPANRARADFAGRRSLEGGCHFGATVFREHGRIYGEDYRRGLAARLWMTARRDSPARDSVFARRAPQMNPRG